MHKTKRSELMEKAAEIVDGAYRYGWSEGIRHVTGARRADPERHTPMSLLERFVDLYGERRLRGEDIAIGARLWRDYYDFSGVHMVRTEEGWEPGSVKAEYLAQGVEILDEVNAPEEVAVQL